MSGVGAALLGGRDAIETKYAAELRPDLFARARTTAGVVAIFGALIASLWYVGFTPWLFVTGLGKLGFVIGFMFPPNPQTWETAQFYIHALFQTVAIAFAGTLTASVIAFPLAFLAARNVVPNWIIHILSRRFFDSIRGVDTMIWALIWINVVGLGPFAGVLAIISTDVGVYGKLFSEAIETADRKPVEGLMSAGGTKLQMIRFSLIPQLMPVVLSQLLYFFESNTRQATVLGIVGAGGIGLPLSEMIRTDEWQQVSFIIIMLLITVAAIDWASTRLRFSLLGKQAIR